jgi:predicted secreted protein
LISKLVNFVVQTLHAVHFKRQGGVQALNVTTADIISLTLEGKPSTGYSWSICCNSTDAVVLDTQKETDIPPNNWTFNFTVVSKVSGKYAIVAGYSKPWLHGAPEQTSTVILQLTY